jgi:XamI restriction endonuclease
MAINADKPHLWNQDITASVDLFNRWFMRFAPKAFRDSRVKATRQVEEAILLTEDLRALSPALLRSHPKILPTLRMCTCPPLARDRLIGLSGVSRSLVGSLEQGMIPPRLSAALLAEQLNRLVRTLSRLLDKDILPWLAARRMASDVERHRASTIVADRLCGSVSDPIVRNAQEKRQLALVAAYLRRRGYRQQSPSSGRPLTEMQAGTYAFRVNVLVGEAHRVKVPIDAVIQPRVPRPTQLPILVEAKSAGDFTNVNKRRKEEAKKMEQLRATYGSAVEYILFLCGYFDSGYLGYEAAEGIDWIWEHRLDDLAKLGI